MEGRENEQWFQDQCPVHLEDQTSYCIPCQIYVCPKCKGRDHKGHKVLEETSIMRIYSKYKLVNQIYNHHHLLLEAKKNFMQKTREEIYEIDNIHSKIEKEDKRKLPKEISETI